MFYLIRGEELAQRYTQLKNILQNINHPDVDNQILLRAALYGRQLARHDIRYEATKSTKLRNKRGIDNYLLLCCCSTAGSLVFDKLIFRP